MHLQALRLQIHYFQRLDGVEVKLENKRLRSPIPFRTVMASGHATLDAAAAERKLRLAKLKSLKRKQPDSYSEIDSAPPTDPIRPLDPSETYAEPHVETLEPSSVTTTYLSGRNYDPSTRGPKLGFESAPIENQETLEDRAAQIVEETHVLAEQEERDEKPIDLFKLQPKKQNWDLKRDMERKMERLNTRTDNAIARLVRERIETAKRKAETGRGSVGDEVGMKGGELVEGIRVREREEEEEERKEKEEDEEVA